MFVASIKTIKCKQTNGWAGRQKNTIANIHVMHSHSIEGPHSTYTGFCGLDGSGGVD